VVTGKGQFTCGSRKCEEHEKLRTWEVNFAYKEDDEKKNVLVKVRLCPDCSYKLNYYHRKKEVTKRGEERKRKRLKKDKKKRKKGEKSRKSSSSASSDDSSDEEVKKKRKEEEEREKDKKLEKEASNIWSKPVEMEEEKSREEDFSEYLDELFM